MAYYGINNNNNNNKDDGDEEYGYNTTSYSNYEYKRPPSWISIILSFTFFWPVGIYLLIKRLTYMGESSGRTSSYKSYTPPKNKNNKNNPASALGVIGAVLAASGFVTLATNGYYFGAGEIFLCAGMMLGGIGTILYSRFEKKRTARFTKYQTIIGDKKCMSISEIAAKIPVSRKKAMNDLQEMINRDYFKGAYIDASRDIIVYSGSEPAEEKKQKPEDSADAKNKFVPGEYQKYINQIKDVNNRIKNESLSDQIYRIENITQRIFDYVSDKPEKQSMIRTFMQYYLPTTLKILNAYAEFERQDIDGKYIGSGKKDIEETMGKVVTSFENLLDKLYMSDVIDISTDIDALEGMLVNDGFADNDDLTLKI